MFPAAPDPRPLPHPTNINVFLSHVHQGGGRARPQQQRPTPTLRLASAALHIYMATAQYASDGRRLPRGWVELLDEEGSVYYWHTKKDERLFPPDFP